MKGSCTSICAMDWLGVSGPFGFAKIPHHDCTECGMVLTMHNVFAALFSYTITLILSRLV